MTGKIAVSVDLLRQVLEDYEHINASSDAEFLGVRISALKATLDAQESLCDLHQYGIKHGVKHVYVSSAPTPKLADPCPGCRPGVVCKTPNCGRLKRSAAPVSKEVIKPAGEVVFANLGSSVVNWFEPTSAIADGDRENAWSWPIRGDKVYLSPPEQVSEPVAWEWRWFDASDNTVTSGQWSEWKRVEPRNQLCTVEDSLNEFRAYIANGQRYELRPLFTTFQPQTQAARRTDQQIVDQTEELAKFLLSWKYGHEPETSESIVNSEHPKAKDSWNAACHVQEMLTNTDPENAFSEVQDATHSGNVERLTDAEVREIYLANGFTVKDGQTDLKPYVFESARAIQTQVLKKNGLLK